MKSIVKNRLFLFILLFLTILACNALSLPLWDLSTDTGVLGAYNTITEQNLTLEDVCILRPPDFNEVVLIGMFATDVGCQGDELFVGQTLGHFDNLTAQGLNANGWNDRTREDLARLWTEEVLLAWRTPVQVANPDFDQAGVPFTPPTVQTLSDDRIQVELWVQEPAGMLPETAYTNLQVIFEPDGSLGEQTPLNQFSVSFTP